MFTMDDRWARNLLVGILITLVGGGLTLGVPGLFYLGSLAAGLDGARDDITMIGTQLQELIRHDLADVKRRLTIMEGKGILPDAERRVSELERLVRELEKRHASDPRHPN